LQNLDFFAELIDMERENRQEQGKCWPAIMVAGNKCDLQGQRQVGAAEGLEWAKSRGCGFMETSAREVVNIEETFACKFHFTPLLTAAETDFEPQQSSNA
jgi:GTPase KRas protein